MDIVIPFIKHSTDQSTNQSNSQQINPRTHTHKRGSEALPVHNGGATLIVFLFGDPHLLEGGQRGQDGATDPHRVLPFWGSDDLHLHWAGGNGRQLFAHPVGQTCNNSVTVNKGNMIVIYTIWTYFHSSSFILTSTFCCLLFYCHPLQNFMLS